MGKSTAVLVALGLLAPDDGRVGLVAADGAFRDLADLSAGGLEGWWGALTWVPQRPSLPPGRLREVVLDGKPGDVRPARCGCLPRRRG